MYNHCYRKYEKKVLNETEMDNEKEKIIKTDEFFK